MKRGVLVAFVGVLLVVAVGCANRSRGPQEAPQFKSDLLFGPAWAGYASRDTPRSAWPSTRAYDSDEETVSFRETIIDRQGRFLFGRDDYYRRFDSVREGRIRR